MVYIDTDILEPTDKISWQSTKTEVERVFKVLSERKVWKFLWIVGLFTVTPMLTSTYSFYYTMEIKLELAQMSKLSLSMSIAYFFSILAVNFLFDERNFKTFFLITGYLSAALNLSILLIFFKYYKVFGLSPLMLCYILHSSATFIQELNFLPLLGACCKLCPEDLEAASFGVFTSLFNTGNFLASLFAGFLLNIVGVSTKRYKQIWAVIVVQVCFQICVLSFLVQREFPQPFQQPPLKAVSPQNIAKPKEQPAGDQQQMMTELEDNSPKVKEF